MLQHIAANLHVEVKKLLRKLYITANLLVPSSGKKSLHPYIMVNLLVPSGGKKSLHKLE